MCGIAAVVAAGEGAAALPASVINASVIDASVIEAALAVLSGRGPDGGRAESAPGVTLLATRLIQWDEGAPRQPYGTAAGDRAVFNGELFNLGELQAYVGLPGAPEIAVLLEGLRRWGPGFLGRVDGQFAVVARLADGTTYAARDRFGIAPLFAAATVGGHVFASSLAAIQALTGPASRAGAQTRARAHPAYDVAGLASLLADWAPTGMHTPYRGVDQVPPGHVVILAPDEAGGGVRVDRWARAGAPSQAGTSCAPRPPDPPPRHASPAAATSHRDDDPFDAADLEDRLRSAIRVRLRCVTPVACLVSGGIDSTVIAAIAAEEGARLGLGLWLDGDELTRDRQREAAAAAGLDLLQHRLTATETLATFTDYVITRRMPLVRLGPVGMTALARRARAEGVRTVLSGEGADEVFCGYDSYRLIAARGGAFGPVDGLDWDAFGAPEVQLGRGERWRRAYWRGLIALGGSTPSRVAILAPVAELFGPVLAEAWTLAASGWVEPPGPGRVAVAGSGGVGGDVGGDAGGVSAALRARREEDLATLLAAYLLVVQGDHAWLEEGIELRPPYLSAVVADWALARDPATFVAVERGKLPIHALLARLARRRPTLAGLGFAKSAFRVDARLLLGDEEAYDGFRAAVAACPPELVDARAVLDRLDRGRRAGTLSEAESMIATLAASFGLLAG